MDFCVNFDDGTPCIVCGECGKELCCERSNVECDLCGYCEK